MQSRLARVFVGVGFAWAAGWVVGANLSRESVPGAFGAKPLAAALAKAQGPRFRLLAARETGLDFVHRWNPTPSQERLLNSSAVGGGVCAGDFDADGLPDLCLTRPAGGFRLFHNDGGLRFTDVTERAGVRDDSVWTTGSSFADVNGDGRLDLYVCCYDAPNRLFINRGNGTFQEQAAAYGLAFRGASMMMAFADYDRDGKLDGYLLTAGLMPGPAQKFRVRFEQGKPVVPEELQEYWQIFHLPGERAATAEAGQRDHLFHNDGDGRFSEVSEAAKITGCEFGNAAVWWDYDADGWPDLYVANDYYGPDHLYRNNGDGTFSDRALEVLPSTPWTSMGADVADFNNDGLLDLVASDMSGPTRFKRLIDSGDMDRAGWFLDWAEPRQHQRNALFINTGKNRFLEVAQMAGVAHTDWTWSMCCGDLDADGLEDIFVPNGMTRDWMDNDLALASRGLPPADYARFWQKQPIRRDRNLAYRNLDHLQFTEVSASWGLDHEGPSFGAVLVDLDGDGLLDIVVNDFESSVRVYHNEQAAGNRIAVRLRGVASNRHGLGAMVQVETLGGRQTRYATLSRGFMSAGEPVAHFGLGTASKITRLSVRWPNGRRQELTDLGVNGIFDITEPVTPESPGPEAASARSYFTTSSLFANLRHQAGPADDFQLQPLLPWTVSESGPALVAADLQDNGGMGFYLCGSVVRPGALYRRAEESGVFHEATGMRVGPPVDELDAEFFDANSDGRPDLFVLDARPGASLFLNHGRGIFKSAAAESLPSMTDLGGCAAAGDFDRDGDMDLFLGGRWLPGRYPLSAHSHVWRNDQGVFRDVTATVGEGLATPGCVTGALWSDVDSDGWPDLVLATGWGPVRLFQNREGHLVERTEAAGLGRWLGWWSSLAGGDLDRDGDMDFVVGNLGLNTRYQPTPAEPSRLYAGTFAGEGDLQLVEAVVLSTGTFPVRGRGALEKVVPSIAERFPTHRGYASASLAELVGADVLARASRHEVNTAATGVLLNDGAGRFVFRPLPRLAQTAPVLGIALADFDGDNRLDVCLAQNFSGAQRETGRMNGGVGGLFLGQGNGTFTPVWPERSGLVIPEDGRGVVAADFTGDGQADLVMAVRNGVVRAYENRMPRRPAGSP